MEVQRTVQIVIEPSKELEDTLMAFTQVCNKLSPTAYNNGKFLGRVALHYAAYTIARGVLSSQMTCTAIRLTAGAYAAIRRNRRKTIKPICFRKPRAMFLVGTRGRDASFRRDGRLSIWTVRGRRKLSYSVPEYFKPMLACAKTVDSINVIEKNRKLIGFVSITIDVPDAVGVHPVGVDLNETNPVVAVDDRDRELFVAGAVQKERKRRIRKTRKRLQKRLASRKAEGKSTKSVGRVLKRLRERQSRSTKDFCHVVSKKLVNWSPKNSVLVFEDLSFEQGDQEHGKAWNRRFHEWPRGQIVEMTTYKAEGKHEVAFINPAYTSQRCSRCGLLGNRNRHSFICPHCQFRCHADLNAARNIRNHFAVLRRGGPSSTGPEASSRCKPPALAAG